MGQSDFGWSKSIIAHHNRENSLEIACTHLIKKKNALRRILTQNVKVDILEFIAVLVADVALDNLSISLGEVAEDNPLVCYRQPWVVVWNAAYGISKWFLAKPFLSMKQQLM